MKNKNPSSSVHWSTPDTLYQTLDQEFNFDFDPCPLHSDFDGLSVEWGRRNFVNPPYSLKLKEAFVIKAIEESLKGNLSAVLLPVSTSTTLFHEFITPFTNDIRFLKRRIKFKGFNDSGEFVDSKTGTFDSMLAIFDCSENRKQKLAELTKWSWKDFLGMEQMEVSR